MFLNDQDLSVDDLLTELETLDSPSSTSPSKSSRSSDKEGRRKKKEGRRDRDKEGKKERRTKAPSGPPPPSSSRNERNAMNANGSSSDNDEGESKANNNNYHLHGKRNNNLQRRNSHYNNNNNMAGGEGKNAESSDDSEDDNKSNSVDVLPQNTFDNRYANKFNPNSPIASSNSMRNYDYSNPSSPSSSNNNNNQQQQMNNNTALPSRAQILQNQRNLTLKKRMVQLESSSMYRPTEGGNSSGNGNSGVGNKSGTSLLSGNGGYNVDSTHSYSSNNGGGGGNGGMRQFSAPRTNSPPGSGASSVVVNDDNGEWDDPNADDDVGRKKAYDLGGDKNKWEDDNDEDEEEEENETRSRAAKSKGNYRGERNEGGKEFRGYPSDDRGRNEDGNDRERRRDERDRDRNGDRDRDRDRDNREPRQTDRERRRVELRERDDTERREREDRRSAREGGYGNRRGGDYDDRRGNGNGNSGNDDRGGGQNRGYDNQQGGNDDRQQQQRQQYDDNNNNRGNNQNNQGQQNQNQGLQRQEYDTISQQPRLDRNTADAQQASHIAEGVNSALTNYNASLYRLDGTLVNSNSNNRAEEKQSSPPPQAVNTTPFNLSELKLDSNLREFLMTPVPRRAGTIQCYIKRNKSGTNKLFPAYSVFMKEGNRFLMTSKRRPNNKTSNYLISCEKNDHNRSSINYLGKVRANFVGTEFQVYDSGVNPKDGHVDYALHNTEVRQDLGCVLYASNVLGSRGPRKMQVCINKANVESEGMSIWQPKSEEDEMLNQFKSKIPEGLSRLVSLINKPPRWNDQVGAYVLNFNGRVTMASVKNFQLVDQDDHDTIILQFGRVAKDEFTMDFQFPMTPFQAFAITLSSFDSKIACD